MELGHQLFVFVWGPIFKSLWWWWWWLWLLWGIWWISFSFKAIILPQVRILDILVDLIHQCTISIWRKLGTLRLFLGELGEFILHPLKIIILNQINNDIYYHFDLFWRLIFGLPTYCLFKAAFRLSSSMSLTIPPSYYLFFLLSSCSSSTIHLELIT